MLTGLDPHSAFLDQDAYRDLQVGTQGEFGGLGIEVGAEDGFVKVVAPIEDTPAYRAGVQAGDLIIKLDEMSLKGITLNDAVKKMRGKPNTEVKLTILRKGSNDPLEIIVKRDVIKVKSVKARMLEPGYGLVRITQFQEHTGENLVVAINDLYKRSGGELKGLVLDLRLNPGGLLNSEIVAGALQDHHRAVILGTQTFGKGSVQTILPLPNNQAVKLTTARYYTPGGRSIQAKGISPDIVVEDAPDQRVILREADLQHHLSVEEDKSAIDAATK